MTLPCPVGACDRVMPGNLRVCRACSARLIRDLADVPSLGVNLEISLTRQARIGDRGAGRSKETPIPWVQEAREAGDVLKSALVGWHRALAQGAPLVSGPLCAEYDCDHPSCEWAHLRRTPPANTPAGLSAWLLRHRARLLRHPAVEEAVDEICDAVAQARIVVDRPADRIYAGPCAECDRDLYAQVGSSIVSCACGAVYGVTARREWMRREVEGLIGDSVWVAGVVTALGYPVSSSTIREWKRRGRITPRSYAPSLNPGAEPRPLYRVGDVIERITRVKEGTP